MGVTGVWGNKVKLGDHMGRPHWGVNSIKIGLVIRALAASLPEAGEFGRRVLQGKGSRQNRSRQVRVIEASETGGAMFGRLVGGGVNMINKT